MRSEPSPVTQMLIRQMQEVKHLIKDVREKMDHLATEEILEKKKEK